MLNFLKNCQAVFQSGGTLIKWIAFYIVLLLVLVTGLLDTVESSSCP